jgi:23S rRNA pseudouridine1911/1915/1917 synthase
VDLANQFLNIPWTENILPLFGEISKKMRDDKGSCWSPSTIQENHGTFFLMVKYGKEAVTHFRVLERLNYVTLVECKLETGRTHQIRVHMQHIGHPLFNDDTYGGDRVVKGTIFTKYKQFVENCFNICPRHALHAQTLGFTHPRSRQRMQFTSELPEDMEKLIQKWRRYISPKNQIM